YRAWWLDLEADPFTVRTLLRHGPRDVPIGTWRQIACHQPKLAGPILQFFCRCHASVEGREKNNPVWERLRLWWQLRIIGEQNHIVDQSTRTDCRPLAYPQ